MIHWVLTYPYGLVVVGFVWYFLFGHFFQKKS